MDSSSHRAQWWGGGWKELCERCNKPSSCTKAMNFWAGSDSIRFSRRTLFLCAAIFHNVWQNSQAIELTWHKINYEPERKRQEQLANNSPGQNKPKHKRANGRPGRLAFRTQSVAGMTRTATRSNTSYIQTALVTSVSGHRTPLVLLTCASMHNFHTQLIIYLLIRGNTVKIMCNEHDVLGSNTTWGGRSSVLNEHVHPVAYPGILFGGGGGFNKFSWEQRTERTGIWGL